MRRRRIDDMDRESRGAGIRGESVALQVTVVAPSGKRAPDAGAQVTTAIGPSTRSVAVGAV